MQMYTHPFEKIKYLVLREAESHPFFHSRRSIWLTPVSFVPSLRLTDRKSKHICHRSAANVSRLEPGTDELWEDQEEEGLIGSKRVWFHLGQGHYEDPPIHGKNNHLPMQKPVRVQELIIIARDLSTWVKALLVLCVLCITTKAQKAHQMYSCHDGDIRESGCYFQLSQPAIQTHFERLHLEFA